MKTHYLIYFLLTSNFILPQSQKSYILPVDIPIQLSGTFGELRKNHFHAGLDIRTRGREGLPIRSIKSGWINRLKVSLNGYGKALYIEHNDGLVSVYAHLKKFNPRIESYLKKKQYSRKSFSIELFPGKNELKVNEGEVIGYSGNTGGSFGPHLHFELREANGQIPINPIQYGNIHVEDSRNPQIQSFYLYKGFGPNEKRKEFLLVKKNDSVYTTAGVIEAGRLNIGLEFFDRQNLSQYKNGIYSAKAKLNGLEIFSYKMNKISFNDSKYINLFLDYNELISSRRKIHRFFLHPEQKISFLKDSTLSGEILVENGKSYQLLIQIQDYNKNTSHLEVYLKGIPEIISPEMDVENLILIENEYNFEFENKSVFFPKKSFFYDVNLKVEEKGDTLKVGENIFPLKKPFSIKYRIPEGDSLKITQSFLAFLDKNGKSSFLSRDVNEGYWEAKSKILGSFIVSRDSIAPEIRAQNFRNNQWVNDYSFLNFRISDDYSGIKRYKGEINGKWILLEFEPKKNRLFYNLDDIDFDTTLHNLKIEAEDQAGNKTVYKIKYYRKSK